MEKVRGVDCRHLSPDKTSHTSLSRKADFFAAVNTPCSYPLAMTLDTQVTLDLLQKLMWALRATVDLSDGKRSECN